jgi:hypothetical protein
VNVAALIAKLTDNAVTAVDLVAGTNDRAERRQKAAAA